MIDPSHCHVIVETTELLELFVSRKTRVVGFAVTRAAIAISLTICGTVPRMLVAVWLIATTSILAAEPPITTVVFSPDGQSIVSGSQRGIQVFRWPSLERADGFAHNAELLSPNVHALRFSPCGDRIAVGGGAPSDEGFVELFTWPELKLTGRLQRHSDSVKDIVWLSDSTIASASLDHEVVVWDIESEKPIQVLNGHSRGVTSLCHIPSKNILVSAGIDQSLRVWSTDSWKIINSLGIHTLPVNDLALRPVREGLPMVASASDDRSVRFWQPSIGRMVRFARLKSKPLAISWTTEGDAILAACTDGQLRVIDPDTVEVLESKNAIDGWAYCVGTHPSYDQSVVGGTNGKLVRVKFDR